MELGIFGRVMPNVIVYTHEQSLKWCRKIIARMLMIFLLDFKS